MDQSLKNNTVKTRKLCIELIDSLMADGCGKEALEIAKKCAEIGFFSDSLQRPEIYFSGLTSKPFHAPLNFPELSVLEDNFNIIQREVTEYLLNGGPRFSQVEEPLVGKGDWQEIVFFEAGVESAKSAQALPQTFNVLKSLPDEIKCAGVIMLSKISPNSHILPHCGYTNGRLRAHLGILIPDDVLLRVKDETVQWQEGKLLIMDDSYEHEVWHYGKTDRVVLIVDLFHPELKDFEKKKLLNNTNNLQQRLRRLMAEQHIKSIVKTNENIVLKPDEYLDRKLSRYLDELDADEVNI